MNSVQTAVIAATRQHHERVAPFEKAVHLLQGERNALVARRVDPKNQGRASAAAITLEMAALDAEMQDASEAFGNVLADLADHSTALRALCDEHDVTFTREPALVVVVEE